MALTIDSASVKANGDNGIFAVDFQIDFDSSYPTGGEDISTLLSTAGVADATPFAIFVEAALTSGRTLLVDPDNTKVLVLDNAGAEISNGTNLSAMTNVKGHLLCY